MTFIWHRHLNAIFFIMFVFRMLFWPCHVCYFWHWTYVIFDHILILYSTM